MHEIIFLIFTVLISGTLILMSFKSNGYRLPTMFVVALLCLSAFYLFQFGPLGSFSLKALSAEARFVREKKQEVAQDAEIVDAMKKQIEQLLSDSRKSQDKIETTKNEIVFLQSELAKTTQLAMPPTLDLTNKTTNNISNGGFKVTLQFTPSNNVPLGIIVFEVTIIDDGDVRILNLWPSIEGGPFSTGPDSKKIREDRKQGHLGIFTPFCRLSDI